MFLIMHQLSYNLKIENNVFYVLFLLKKHGAKLWINKLDNDC